MGWEKVIDQFWQLNLIKNPADIFELNYDKIKTLEGWGDLSVQNLEQLLTERKTFL